MFCIPSPRVARESSCSPIRRLAWPEQRHAGGARERQADSDPAGVGAVAHHEHVDRPVCDPRGEDEELRRHEALGALLGMVALLADAR